MSGTKDRSTNRRREKDVYDTYDSSTASEGSQKPQKSKSRALYQTLKEDVTQGENINSKNLKSLKNENYKLKQVLNEHIAQNVSLEKLCKKYEEEKQTDTNRYQDQANECSKQKQVEIDLSRENDKIVRDISDIKEQLNSTNEIVIKKKDKLKLWKRKFAEETRDLRDQCAMLEGEKSLLERKLNEQDKCLNDENERNNGLDLEIIRLRQEFDNLQGQVSESREECHKKEGLAIELRLRIEGLEKENHDFRQRHQEALKEKEDLVEFCQNQKKEQKEKKRIRADQEKDKVDLINKEMDGLNYEFNELKNAHGVSQTQLSESKRANLELTKTQEVQQFQLKKMAELESEHTRLKEAQTSLLGDSHTKKLELDDKTQAIQDYEKRTQEILHQNEKLQNEVDRRGYSEENLRGCLDKATTEIEEIKEENTRCVKTNTQLEAKLEELDRNQQNELASLEQKISNVLSDMHQLKEENGLMFNEKKYLETVKDTLTEALEKYRIKYREKKIESKGLKQKNLKVRTFLVFIRIAE